MIKIDPSQLEQSLLYLPRDLGKAIAALTGEHIGKRMRVLYLEAISIVPLCLQSPSVGYCVAAVRR